VREAKIVWKKGRQQGWKGKKKKKKTTTRREESFVLFDIEHVEVG
jgi:hypothetical protein